MALGIVALYLGIAIGLSTWLRPLIGYTWWRRLHVLTLLVYALATVHGIGTGSDTQTWWGLSIYLVSIVLVGALLYRRLFAPDKRKRTPAPAPVRRTTAAAYTGPRPLNGAESAARSGKGKTTQLLAHPTQQ
jgi:predicted ferric reductase